MRLRLVSWHPFIIYVWLPAQFDMGCCNIVTISMPTLFAQSLHKRMCCFDRDFYGRAKLEWKRAPWYWRAAGSNFYICIWHHASAKMAGPFCHQISVNICNNSCGTCDRCIRIPEINHHCWQVQEKFATWQRVRPNPWEIVQPYSE